MTILAGEHYVIETMEQFCERTDFDRETIARSLQTGTHGEKYDIDGFLAEMDEIYTDELGESVDSIEDLHEQDLRELFGALNVNTGDAIMDTLEQDDREWVHLFNGTTHDIVQIYD